MGDLLRALTAFRARPMVERVALLRRAMARVRTDGLVETLRWARGSGAVSREPDRYRAWCAANTPDAAALASMRVRAGTFAERPLISILTATFNSDPAWLEAAADSIIAQAYERWEWQIGDDGSTHPGTLAALERLASCDPRIVVHRSSANGGVSAASNLALSHATGELVALMDHDDALLPHALYRIVEALNGSEPRPDVIYSDEDKLDAAGERCDPYFKPDWSPDLFRSSMYACHLLVIRRALVAAVGGFRSAFDFSQDYDLLLRVIEQTGRIAHVPDVLYHWRKAPASTASSAEAKPTAHGAGARALQAHLDRQKIAGRIEDAGPAGLYRVRYEVVGRPRVAVLMPTRSTSPDDLGRTVSRLIAATDYPDMEVVLISHDGVVPPDVPEGVRVRGLMAAGAFGHASWINQGARATRTDHLLLIHDDIVPQDGGWMRAMVELSQQPWVGAVGAKLLDAADRLDHIGLIVGLTGVAGRPFAGHAAETVGYYSGANCIRNCTAVSGACLMTRADVFEKLGGLDTALTGANVDVDYGLKVNSAGLRVVFTPYARLTHLRSDGRAPDALAPGERSHLAARWGDRLASDPCYNPNLSYDALDYRIGPITQRQQRP